ncbi:hypothetical protein Pla111_00320 [Botrimarina hoheduenensis]|uniref:Uncharacterized protein n=2 Tax=Botrimarina hoheduenensis TaxID=2528000 RepID=A0A5C5WDY2_9BACT|nr:hypothetical protein Pla111_00320 [Botrimarina hoheduenensis]
MVQIVPPDTAEQSAAQETPVPGSGPTTLVLGSTLETLDTDQTLADAGNASIDEQLAASAKLADDVAAATAPPAPAVPTPKFWRHPGLMAAGGIGFFTIGVTLTLWLRQLGPSAPEPSPNRPLATAASEAPLFHAGEQPPIEPSTPQSLPSSAGQAPIEEPAGDAELVSIGTANLPSVESPSIENPSEAVEAEPAAGSATADAETRSLPSPPPDEADSDLLASTATTPFEATASLTPPADFDPLEYDPATIELVLRSPSATDSLDAPHADSEGSPLDPLPDESSAPPTAEALLDQQLAEKARHNGVLVVRGPTSDPDNQPPTLSAERLLAVTLPESDLTEAPLSAAIDFFSALSGTPISLTPAALRRAGIDPRTTISFVGLNASISEVLSEGLASRRLMLRTEGAQAIIERLGASEQRRVTHRLEDLAGDGVEDLEQLLRRFGPPSVASATIESNGLLTIEARQAEQYDLLVFCERLRVARGLPPQTRYPRSRLVSEPALKLLDKPLSRRTTFSFVEPTPLRDIFEHVANLTRLTILIDWPSLAEDAGLGPRSTLSAATTNRRWSDALEGLLEALDLGWVPIDGRTVWIASRQKLAAEPVIDFYPASPAAGPGLAERLAPAHPQAEIVYDPRSRCVLVRGNLAAHRAVWQAVSTATSREG